MAIACQDGSNPESQNGEVPDVRAPAQVGLEAPVAPQESAAWSDPVPVPAAPQWSVRVEWIAGVAEGEGLALGNITSLSVGPDQRVYAIDFTNQQIVVLDSFGKHVRSIGRAGRGPGEFDGPLAMAWDPTDRLWIADGWNQRYTVLDTSGAVVTTIPRHVSGMSGFTQRLQFQSASRIVDETATSVGGKYSVQFLGVDTSGVVVDSLLSAAGVAAVPADLSPAALASAQAALRPLRDFMPRLVLAVDAAGNLWSAESDVYEVVQRRMTGDTVLTIRGPDRQIKLSRESQVLIERQVHSADLDERQLRIGKQIIQSIHVNNDGYVFVQLEDSTGRAGRFVDIFSATGVLEAHVELPAQVKPATQWSFRADTAFAVVLDDLDVNYIAKLVLERN